MRQRFLLAMVLGISLMCQSLFHYALDPQKKITQYMHDVWGIEQGLPQSSVDVIFQSRDGYLWLGTQEGLVRFDGADFKVFEKNNTGLPSQHIRSIYQDQAGNLWIGAYGGISCLNAISRKFTTFNNNQEISGNIITTICEGHEGHLWFGTEESGLKRLKSGTTDFNSYTTKHGLSDNSVRAIITDRGGNLWIGTDNGLNRAEPKEMKFTLYTKMQGLSDNKIYSLYEDRKGNLWIGTDNGLDCLDIEDGKFTIRTFPTAAREELSNVSIRAICEDRDGNLWIGSLGKGMIRLNPQGLKERKPNIHIYTTEQGLSDNKVNSLYEDVEGSLWIGTWGGGLNRLKDGKFTTYTTAEGLSNDIVLSIYEDQALGLWIGTDNGLNLLGSQDLGNGKITLSTIKHSLSNNIARSICKDPKGNLWIGSYGGGLYHLDRRKKDGDFHFIAFTQKNSLSNNFVRVVYVDTGGTLWIGTEGGLNFLEDGRFKTFTTKEGLTNNIVWSIYEDREGNLWIGTRQGLNHLDRHRKDRKFILTKYTTKDGLSSDIIGPIYEDREGNLWLGTFGGGLNRLKDGKFTHVTTKEGLFNDVVFTILEDDKGDFWMSCNKGIFRVSQKELNDCCEGRINNVHCVSYNEKDGMKSRECNGGSQPSGWKSRDGKLWFPTVKGVVVVDPNNININRLPPPVKIEEFTAGNKKIHPPFSTNGERLIFSPGNKRFEIHYTALSLLVPEKVRFKCKLEGLEEDWMDVGTRRTAYYTKIPPGNYTFRVMACNNDGIWNEAGAAVSFYLKPYFYHTWWFYIMCAFAALFLAFGIFRLRVKQITDRKIELERLVDERTRQLEESGKELQKLSIVARETHNAVTIMDAKGNLEWMNDGATRMYGYTLEQVVKEKGRNIIQISSNPNIRELFAEFITKRESLRYESLYRTRDGKKIWTQTTWTPILDHKGNLTKIVAIGSDITRLKQSKDQIDKQNKEIREQNQRILEQAERLKEAIKIAREEREIADAANQAKSEFLARMSHEIRTPMNSVIGFSEMLMDTRLNEEQQEFAGTICRSGEALITIIDDILDFSKIEAGILAFDSIDFDPEVMAFDICELTMPRIEERPIEILCRIGDRVPAFVKQDPGRFRQVLINLMGNAAKFTEKGDIELAIDVAEETENRLKLHCKVRDTGIGIPPDKQDSIFEVFQQMDGSVTRKFGGTGLGLAICKQIAKHMGGDIRVESTPGQGSTFHFYAWVERSRKTPEEKPVLTDLTGKRILIVDDNLHNLDILDHILKKHGMSVVKQTSGEKVIPILQENLGNGTPFDLCILDLLMPEPSGYEVAQQIRALDSPVSGLPLLAFSSSSYRQAEKYREYGFDAFLPKPIRSQKLLRVMEQLLLPEKTGTERAKEERSELVTQHSVIENAKHSVRILLAEDNPVNRKLTVFLLTKAGYQLDIAENGKEAVKKYTSAPDRYDLIFMDIQMPEMDGREATRKIREKGFDRIPIIAMTAESMKGDEEKCLAAGMNDYISKPIRREIVFEMIKKWVLTKNK